MAGDGKEGHAGDPGEPGRPSDGREGGAGGKGGAGGVGGAGQPEGAGGVGGGGGMGGRGAQGQRGERGPAANEGVSYWKQTGVIPRWQLLGVYALIVAAGAFGLAQTQHIAHRADALARDIQQQRVMTIEQSCEQQNARHDATIATLDRLIARIPPGAEHDRALANRRGTVLLIDALAVKRDCGKVVAEATRTP
jgi:predicted transcriptional regulator